MPVHHAPAATGHSRRAFIGGVVASVSLMVPRDNLLAETPAQTVLQTVAFDGDALLAAGSGLLRSDDDGESWVALSPPDDILALATHPNRPGRIVVGRAAGGVLLSEDGGRSWELRADGMAAGEIDAIAVAAGEPDTIYAAIRGDGLWRSENAGRTWSLGVDRPWLREAEQDLLALASVNLASGMGGIWLYAGTSSGLTRIPDCFCRWQSVHPGDAMDALASGDVLPSEAPLPADEPILALTSAPSSPGTLHAALPSGIWTSRDGGVVWSRLATGAASAVAVHSADERRLVAVLDSILTLSRDGGATWTAVTAAGESIP